MRSYLLPVAQIPQSLACPKFLRLLGMKTDPHKFTGTAACW